MNCVDWELRGDTMRIANFTRSGALALTFVAGMIGTANAESPIVRSNNMIGISFADTHIDYTETGNGVLGADGVTLDTEKGWVPGVRITASLMRDLIVDKFYLAGAFTWNNASTKYTGSLIGGVFGSVVQDDGAIVKDFDFRIGKGFDITSNFMVTPFFGFGSHYWDRKVNAGEVYSHDYIGLGLMLQYALTQQLVLSADALAGRTMGAKIDVAFIDPVFNGFAGGLGNSGLYKVGIGADYAVTKAFHLNAGLEYTAFRYGMSGLYFLGDSSCCVGEPRSTSSTVTARVGVSYAFGGDK